jgi:hypothetical protein
MLGYQITRSLLLWDVIPCSLGKVHRCFKGMMPYKLTKLAACFMLIVCMTYSSTLKMEAGCFFETSMNFCWTTCSHIPYNIISHTVSEPEEINVMGRDQQTSLESSSGEVKNQGHRVEKSSNLFVSILSHSPFCYLQRC